MSGSNCGNSTGVGALVAQHRQIERIVCGHVHRPMVVRWAGTVVTTAPATAHQVTLDLKEGSHTSWIMEPPACHLHYWREDAGLVAHPSYIGDYRPPPPSWASRVPPRGRAGSARPSTPNAGRGRGGSYSA